jgi:hypothetical protein
VRGKKEFEVFEEKSEVGIASQWLSRNDMKT